MKVVQVCDGRAWWVTPYKSMDKLYVEVEQEGGKLERQRRYPETDLFVEAPDEVQEGWVYLGDGSFRSDEPERIADEIAAIDGRLRELHGESLFNEWLERMLADAPKSLSNPGDAEPKEVFASKPSGCKLAAEIRCLVTEKDKLITRLEALRAELSDAGF